LQNGQKTKRQKNDWQKNALFFVIHFSVKIFLPKKQGFHLLETNYPVTQLPSYLITQLPRHPIIQLPNYPVT